jgi:hypothetical protein
MALELSRDQVNRLANLGLTAEAHSKKYIPIILFPIKRYTYY